ncbi:MAG TPA: GDYXXLXY domain-containing protein [Thermoanaerobaculia bacterium]|nr:GDYXXLXY domain-containing protein [Thermoanaerobaculia bacterium]
MAEGLWAPARWTARLAEQVGGRLTALPRRWRLAAVVLLAAVQLAMPAVWIVGFERTLAEGRPFRFRAAPVDPADPLRGRYVVLAFEAAEGVPVPGRLDLVWGERVWVRVEEDADGFAKLHSPQRERPQKGDFLRARFLGSAGGEGQTVRLGLPFDRFFLEEGVAPAAERLLWRGLQPRGEGTAEPPDIWAEVRLRDGQAVIADVLVEGVPLREAATVLAGTAGAAPATPAARPVAPGRSRTAEPAPGSEPVP